MCRGKGVLNLCSLHIQLNKLQLGAEQTMSNAGLQQVKDRKEFASWMILDAIRAEAPHITI